MKKKVAILVFAISFLLMAGSALALFYSGEAGQGTEEGISGEATSFCLLHANKGCEASQVSGYRFTVVDCKGNQRGETVDIYRNQYTSVSCKKCEFSGVVFWDDYGYFGYSLVDGQGKVMSKLRLRVSALEEEAFYLEQVQKNKYKESEIDKTEPLPACDQIGTWIKVSINCQSVSYLCTGVRTLNYGDVVLIEPIFSCRVEDLCCALTCSDLARLALSYYGDKVPSGVSAGYSFAWIRKWVYKEFPNSLSVTKKLHASLVNLEPGNKLLFMAKPSEILNGAYGMAIGLELTGVKKPSLAVEKVEIYQGEELIQSIASNGERIFNDYVKANTEYRLRTYFSSEESTYKVSRCITWGNQSSNETGTTDRCYVETVYFLDSVAEKETITAREDWVSERGMIISRGKEQTFVFYGEPEVQATFSFLNSHKESITKAYKGQYVYPRLQFCINSEKRVSLKWEARADSATWGSGVANVYPGVRRNEIGKLTQVTSEELLCSSFFYWSGLMEEHQVCRQQRFPVCIADVELTEIYFTDYGGNRLDASKLPAETRSVLWLSVRNNSEVAVYADIYCREKKQSVKLEAGEEKTIPWEVIDLSPGTVSITAEVYLDDQGKSARWESNAANNVKTLSGKAVMQVSACMMEAGTYHEGTEVYSTVLFQNNRVAAAENVTARIRVLDQYGRTIVQESKRFSCPAGASCPVYFRWRVTAAAAKVVVDFSLSSGEAVCQTESVITVVPVEASVTPDTGYEACGRSFTLDAAPSPQKEGKAQWTEWEADLSWRDYSVSVSCSFAVESESGVMENGTLVLKSGYGFTGRFALTVEGAAQLCTGAQTVYVLFPEFSYRMSVGSYLTLQDGECEFTHFVPLWFPDGEYVFYLVLDDVWTPAGRVTLTVPGRIVISGNMYEDWVVTR